MTALDLTTENVRFWKKVDLTDLHGCWPWLASLDRFGIGQFWLNGRVYTAPRAAWELTHGPVPKKARVMRTCKTRGCVRPACHRVGTSQEEADLRVADGRQARGERQGLARLTDAAVTAIRVAYAEGSATQKELAETHDVRPQTVSLVVRGKTWSHVGGPLTFRGRGQS